MTSNGPAHVVVVGAGISGLACAYRVRVLRPDARVTVLESSPHIGGKIRTSSIAGITVDEAADAFLARVPAAVDLCRELGLDDQFVTPAERRAFVYRHGALRRFPEGMVMGVPTDPEALRGLHIISDAGIDRAVLDLDPEAPLDSGPPPGTDESVGDLVRRRVGDEVFEALVGPLLSGVHAGDADQLSVAAGVAQFAAAVRDQPSLIAGLRAQKAVAATQPGYDPDAPIFFGLRGGTQTLLDALADSIGPESIHLSTQATALTTRPGGGFMIAVEIDGHSRPALGADAVVIATPAFAAADLVDGLNHELAHDLATLEFASVSFVTFAVHRHQITHPLDGSGFLVSDGEGLLMSACSFGSSKWAHWRADPSSGENGAEGDELVILRVSAGRHHDLRAGALDDDELVAALLSELGTTIGLTGPPVETRVRRWNDALPQFRPGHLDRAAAWKQSASATDPGLFLTGASYFGLGIPACIADANQTAHDVVTMLKARS